MQSPAKTLRTRLLFRQPSSPNRAGADRSLICDPSTCDVSCKRDVACAPHRDRARLKESIAPIAEGLVEAYVRDRFAILRIRDLDLRSPIDCVVDIDRTLRVDQFLLNIDTLDREGKLDVELFTFYPDRTGSSGSDRSPSPGIMRTSASKPVRREPRNARGKASATQRERYKHRCGYICRPRQIPRSAGRGDHLREVLPAFFVDAVFSIRPLGNGRSCSLSDSKNFSDLTGQIPFHFPR